MAADWLALSAAATAGLMGGVHCAAMCGGIATGFSGPGNERPSWWRALQPNLGRVLGYTLAGAAVGLFGAGLVQAAQNEWLRVGLRVAVGAVMVVAALRLLDRKGRLSFLPPAGAGVWRVLRPLQKHLLPANSSLRRIGLGMLWGWMPCGLSSTLLVAAWLQADALNSAATMAAFGLGTLPVMLPLTWSGARLGQHLQRGGWRSAAGGLVLASGIITMAAPWLMRAPIFSGLLSALGCVAAPV